jgi:hypothetical protein
MTNTERKETHTEFWWVKLKRKRPHRKSRHRLKENIKTCANWIHLV